MAEIRAINGAELTEDAVDLQIISILEDCLDIAKRGEFVNVAVVGVMPNGRSFDTWYVRQDGLALVGALHGAAHALLASSNTTDHVDPEE